MKVYFVLSSADTKETVIKELAGMHENDDELIVMTPNEAAGFPFGDSIVMRGVSPSKTDLKVLDLAGLVDEHGPIDMPDIEGQETIPRGTKAPEEIPEAEVDAGLDGDTPEEVTIRVLRKEQDISLEVHQEIDILAGKPWDSLVDPDMAQGSFIRIARATLRPAKTRNNETTYILQVYGRDARSGGKVSCRQYFNFFVGSKYARKKARDSFRHLFKLEELPLFFYQHEGSPVSPSGELLMEDREYIRTVDRRANELLKFKMVKILNKKSGYPEMEQYEKPPTTGEIDVTKVSGMESHPSHVSNG